MTYGSRIRVRAPLVLALLLTGLCANIVPRSPVAAQDAPHHQVTWDAHSLLVDGHRVFLYSGEFHYFRLPSRSQWVDRLEKLKAAGLNAVSIYFDWQYHSPVEGRYDFTGVRDINFLLDTCQRLGLYVIARVGPYMNAEVDAGGLPGWLLSRVSFPRSQSWDGAQAHAQYSPDFVRYSKEWYDHLLPILAQYQATDGGPVVLLSIENEYDQSAGSQQYMEDLYHFAREDGIHVPLFHNDYYFKGDWSKVVDLYSFDSYPYGFSCCHQWWDLHFHGMDTWEATIRNQLKVTTPMFVAEMQGGSFDPWGGRGYTAISKTLDGSWLSALDETALAQGTSVLNTYMFVGGTSWGYMSEPGVYTSYDYGAPISEGGTLRPAYYAAHRLGLFLQTYGQSLAGADAAPSSVSSSDPAVVAHARSDGQSGTTFIFLRHGDAGPDAHTHLQLNVSGRSWTVPQQPGTDVTVPGHGTACLLANVSVGALHLNYTTSSVLTDTDTAQGHYFVLYGPLGTAGETDFTLPASGTTVAHNVGVHVHETNGELRLNYRHTDEPRVVSIQTANGTVRLLITTDQRASRFWVDGRRVISGPGLVEQTPSGTRMLASGAASVRVYGEAADSSVSIDGRTSSVPDAFEGATLLGTLKGPATTQLPKLTSWKFAAASPEIDPALDDSGWVLANETSTKNPNVPSDNTLLADDYGFHYGYVWYRGHFTASGKEASFGINARQSFDVYLNGHHLGSIDTSRADPPHTYGTVNWFSIPPSLLRVGADNVISVLTESLGHDEGWLAGPLAQSPQGILSAQLDAGTSISWRLQGAAGGEAGADAIRGPMNASGLFGERQGWYLPQFDDTSWQTVPVPDVWSRRSMTAAVGWYRAHFRLPSRAGETDSIGLKLPRVSDKATIWLNGWLVGRYWQQEGPQHIFYLPDGILQPRGDNVLSIAVWNRGHLGGLTGAPSLVRYGSVQAHELRAAMTPPTQGYWHTAGSRIEDSGNRPVKIAAVNWAGMQNVGFVPAGLDRQSVDIITAKIRALGFNAIRLPFSNQLVEQNPLVTKGLQANPDLQGHHALDIMDRIVQSAGTHGLRVILEDHRSDVGTDPETNGLWYTPEYPESSWLNDWKLLAGRYLDNPTVVGVDLRNEPHTGPPGPWSKYTYLHQGATWGPYKGVENPQTDWRLAAERGGNAVLSINPRLLIFVEGIQQYPDASQPGGIDSYWWGGIFTPARQYPVVLSVPHQLVYSPHEYGPIKWQMPFFGAHMTYQSQLRIWERHWGFLQSDNYVQQAPIFIGEFGTCGQPSCVDDNAPGSQGLWFRFLMRYFKTHPQVSWSFWALNGTNPSGQNQPNYILRQDWKTVRTRALVDTLRDVQLAPPPAQ